MKRIGKSLIKKERKETLLRIINLIQTSSKILSKIHRVSLSSSRLNINRATNPEMCGSLKEAH